MDSQIQVTAILPARDEEENIAAAVESLAAQAEIGEIIVVNDQSSDRTGEILAELAARIPRLRVINNEAAPPEGWSGKNWAVWLGVAEARGAWLLFTDADVVHQPGGVARALEDAARHGAALVSYSPEQVMSTWWERAVTPFIFCRLAAHYPYARINDPACPDAAANGQFLLVRREAYQRVGGHEAVAGEVVEDVAVAQAFKRAGERLYFASGQGIARTRMYRSLPALWEGWRKNLYLLIGSSRAALWRELLLVMPWIPLGMLALGSVHRLLPLLGLVLLTGRHVGYGIELRRNRFPAAVSIYYLCAVAFYAAALVSSAGSYARGRVRWRGREYPVGRA